LTDLGYLSVILGFVLATTLKNALFTPIYAAYILKIHYFRFLKIHIKTIFFAFSFAVICFFSKNIFSIQGLNILIEMGCLSIIGLFMILLFLTKKNRMKIFSIIIKKHGYENKI